MDTDIVMIALLLVQDSRWIKIIGELGLEWERYTNRVGGKIPSEIGKASRLEIINLCK